MSTFLYSKHSASLFGCRIVLIIMLFILIGCKTANYGKFKQSREVEKSCRHRDRPADDRCRCHHSDASVVTTSVPTSHRALRRKSARPPSGRAAR